MIDWVNVASTFGAAIAGSWFGARATYRQTQTNVRLEEHRWLKERAFELIQVIDEFVNFSFRKDSLSLYDRDHLSRRLMSLVALVVPMREAEVEATISDVRNLHVGKRCSRQFEDVNEYFRELKIAIRDHLKKTGV